MQTLDRTTELGKKLFYASYALILVRLMIYGSTLTAVINPGSVLIKYIWHIAAWVLIAVKLITQDAFSPRTFVAYLVFALCVAFGILFHKTYSVGDLILLVVGAHGVRLKEIVRVFFYTASVTCGVLFFLSIIGVIENYTTYRDDIPRYAFGNIYATDFAASLFYIEMSFAYTKRKPFNGWNLLFWTAVAIFVYHFCNARLDFLLIILFALVMFFTARSKRPLRGTFGKTALTAAIPVLCVVSILLHVFYTPESGVMGMLNDLLSGRLYLGNIGVRRYGFSLFGKHVEMQGWGFNLGEWDKKLGYFFVDCGWLSITLRFGVIMTVFVCYAFCKASRRELNEGRIILPVILLFLALTSVVDHHLLELNYDPFILVFNAALCSEGREKRTIAEPAVNKS